MRFDLNEKWKGIEVDEMHEVAVSKTEFVRII